MTTTHRQSPYQRYGKTPYKYNLPLVHVIGHTEGGTTVVGRANTKAQAETQMRAEAARRRTRIANVTIKSWHTTT